MYVSGGELKCTSYQPTYCKPVFAIPAYAPKVGQTKPSRNVITEHLKLDGQFT